MNRLLIYLGGFVGFTIMQIVAVIVGNAAALRYASIMVVLCLILSELLLFRASFEETKRGRQ